ncbi:MAG TPA: universal stress protein [Vicinamibacterales bacterium]|nr:universal stress protein [Vicinamibacterales bacterium]
MSVPPCILCPIDYSDASIGALRYAAAIAERFGARLVVMSVEDPLLTTAMDVGTGIYWSPDLSKGQLQEFVVEALGPDRPILARCEYQVSVGKPPVEILRDARYRKDCELIVMSSHGLTGARKLFFGSTTERVLRETTVPVLVTPAADPGPADLDAAARKIRRIAIPVDLSPASAHQAHIANRIADTLNLHVLLIHVIEPVRSRLLPGVHVAGLTASRRAVAEDALQQLASEMSDRSQAEALIAYGDPAEEAAKVVRDRGAGLVLMGLHGSPLLGPRMGSVTYRILCLCHVPVLAVPPQWNEPAEDQPVGVTTGTTEVD